MEKNDPLRILSPVVVRSLPSVLFCRSSFSFVYLFVWLFRYWCFWRLLLMWFCNMVLSSSLYGVFLWLDSSFAFLAGKSQWCCQFLIVTQSNGDICPITSWSLHQGDIIRASPSKVGIHKYSVRCYFVTAYSVLHKISHLLFLYIWMHSLLFY